MLKRTVFLYLFLFLGACLYSSHPLLINSKNIEIETDQEYAYISKFEILPDGLILLFKESSSGRKPILLKSDENGKFVTKHAKRGQGPSELIKVGNIFVDNRSILVCEFLDPVLHEFNHDLKFIKDHRIKSGGKVVYSDKDVVAIWGQRYHNNLVDLITVYNRKDFSIKGYAYTINKNQIPAFVYHVGGFCQAENNMLAGVYPSEYQIKLFDKDFSFKRNLIAKKPSHIREYYPWKKSKSTVNVNEADKWLASWSIIQDVFFIDNVFIIAYSEGNNKYYRDVLNKKGGLLLSKYNVDFTPECTGKGFLWFVGERGDEEDAKHFVIKTKINQSALEK